MTDDMLSAARRALHLDVPCPVCGAGFSQPCRTSSGRYRSGVHADRTQAHAARERPASVWVQPDLFTVDEVS